HLDVGIELRVGVGVADIGGEIHRRRDGFYLDLDPGLLAGLLDDLLGLLARRVDRGLIDELDPDAARFPGAVRTGLPARLFELRFGLGDCELERGVFGYERLRIVDDVGGRPRGAAVDIIFDRSAIYEEVERLPHRRVGETGVGGLDARPFAVDLGP